jgi:hypothetical protein
MINSVNSNYNAILKLFNFNNKNVENQIIENFLNHKKYSDNTIRSYNRILRVFLSWIKNKEINKIVDKDIVDFIAYIRFTKKLSIRTCNVNLTCIKAFFEYLFDQKSLESNPCKKIKQFKILKNKTKKLDVKQICDVLEKVELEKDFRAKAIFSLLLFTQTKPADLLSINTTNPPVYKNNFVKNSLEEYVSVRLCKKTELLFVGERGPLTNRGLLGVCLKYGVTPRILKATVKNWTEDDVSFILESLSTKFINTKIKQKKSIIEPLERNLLDNFTKSRISVTEMAKKVGLSRQRFNQLVRTNFFPSPDYHSITNRPFYTLEKQKKCFLVKNTNIGVNGESILFYKKRSDTGKKKNKHKRIYYFNNENWIDWV